MHYRLLTDPTYISPCDINATFNCTQVYLSRFGSVRGVPVALGGRDLVWRSWRSSPGFARAGGEGASDVPAGRYLFALATIGLAVILYLGYASFVVLKTGCVLCMGTYVCVIGIFVTAGLHDVDGDERGCRCGCSATCARATARPLVADGGRPLHRGRRDRWSRSSRKEGQAAAAAAQAPAPSADVEAAVRERLGAAAARRSRASRPTAPRSSS